MQPNQIIVSSALGGLAAASIFLPFRGIRRWSWEISWLLLTAVALLLAPAFAAAALLPRLPQLLADTPHPALLHILLAGALCGIGLFTFGLAVRYLGIALGYLTTIGLCLLLGPLATRPFVLHPVPALLSLAAVLLAAFAGLSSQRERSPADRLAAGERDFHLPKGLTAAAITGLTSGSLALGLRAAAPLTRLAQQGLFAAHRPLLPELLPTLLVFLAGAFLTNLLATAILLARHGSARQLAGAPGSNPMRATTVAGNTLQDIDPRALGSPRRISALTLLLNYLLAAIAGLLAFAALACDTLPAIAIQYPATLAPIVLIAALWGIALHEGRGTSARTHVLVTVSLLLLLAATLITP